MSTSPGHRKWPEHKVAEEPVDERMQVMVNGTAIADSDDVVKVEEDRHPDRFYFPRDDVRMDRLERTETVTECPFKGIAHYYAVKTDGSALEDAVWTYEDPYDEHVGLKDRLAFYHDTVAEIELNPR